MADKITIDQFAAYIKQRDPSLASVPDDVLVREALERKPELINFIQTSEPRPPLGSLYERIGRRIKSQADLPAQARDIAKGISGEISNVKQEGLGPSSPFWRTHRLPEAVESVKSTYSDPANIIGDLIGMHILNAGAGGPELGKMAAKGTVATTLQRLSGSGKEPVILEGMARERAIARAQESYAARLAKTDEQNRLMVSQHTQGENLFQNLKKTYQAVSDKLGARWEQLRKTQVPGKLSILKDETGNSKDLTDGVYDAEENFLQGSPGSIRQFRDLMGWVERVKKSGTAPTWDELRTHYSALGDAMYGRNIPNNVFRALAYVRNDVIGKQLEAMAYHAGAGDVYNQLLRDHSQFENDWRNTRSVTRAGGSPLAIAKNAPNAATLIPQVTGRTGDLLVKQLSKYQEHGSSPATAAAIRKMGTINLAKPPVPPRVPPEIDPVAVRRERILQYTSRPKSLYDYLPPRVFTEPLLSNRFIREWVAKYPRREYEVPKPKTPPAPRVSPGGGADTDTILDQMFGAPKQ